MAAMRTTLVTLIAALALSSCARAPEPEPPALVVIGNSLTFHPAVEGLWPHESGMAASDASHAYAQLVGSGLKRPVLAVNFRGLEFADPAAVVQIPRYAEPVRRDSYVVIELGDNVPKGTAAAFAPGYAKLLDAVKGADKLVCVGTWWTQAPVDAVIEAACKERGGRYVPIGDLFPDRKDDIGRYANAGVDAHPHDWAMARIAERVLAALRAPDASVASR